VLENAMNAGNCSDILESGGSCINVAKVGAECTPSTCLDGKLTKGVCLTAGYCDASKLLPNAASPGDCPEELPSGSSCTNTGSEGFTCSLSSCQNGILNAGVCRQIVYDLSQLPNPLTTGSFQGSTVGNLNNVDVDCGNGAEQGFSFQLLPGHRISVRQSINTFNSRLSLRYDGGYPGALEVGCLKYSCIHGFDKELKFVNWRESIVSIYVIVDSWFSHGYGDFVLEWDIRKIGDSCDASSLLANAASLGDCTSQLESGSSCTNTGVAGFNCSSSTCLDGHLSIGSCISYDDQGITQETESPTRVRMTPIPTIATPSPTLRASFVTGRI